MAMNVFGAIKAWFASASVAVKVAVVFGVVVVIDVMVIVPIIMGKIDKTSEDISQINTREEQEQPRNNDDVESVIDERSEEQAQVLNTPSEPINAPQTNRGQPRVESSAPEPVQPRAEYNLNDELYIGYIRFAYANLNELNEKRAQCVSLYEQNQSCDMTNADWGTLKDNTRSGDQKWTPAQQTFEDLVQSITKQQLFVRVGNAFNVVTAQAQDDYRAFRSNNPDKYILYTIEYSPYAGIGLPINQLSPTNPTYRLNEAFCGRFGLSCGRW